MRSPTTPWRPGRGPGPDAVVVGAGPNGLAAALTLARFGLRVEVYERAADTGGGCATEALTIDGFSHDVCAAVHPLAAASPFFASAGLEHRGVKLVSSPVAFAHPLGGDRCAAVAGSVAETAENLGEDGASYRRLFGPLVEGVGPILELALSPLRRVPPSATAARFGILGLRSAMSLARRFESAETRALLAGSSAHSGLPLTSPASGGFALLLTTLAHAVGWPVVAGGSARLTDALRAELESCGGSVHTGQLVGDLGDLPSARVVMLDVAPLQFAQLAGDRLGIRYRSRLAAFRHGPGACKVDWALSGAVPWSAIPPRRAVTVHLGGRAEEIAASEADVAAGRHPERPYCIVVQPGVADPSRAPAGKHTLWAYCHVPNGSSVDVTGRIEDQIERYAPGFRDLILARATRTASQAQARNPNEVGGDVGGGSADLRQLIWRPTPAWRPYRTPLKGVYLCSASTPPGGGVHGMCGLGAARAALADLGLAGGTRGAPGDRWGRPWEPAESD